MLLVGLVMTLLGLVGLISSRRIVNDNNGFQIFFLVMMPSFFMLVTGPMAIAVGLGLGPALLFFFCGFLAGWCLCIYYN